MLTYYRICERPRSHNISYRGVQRIAPSPHENEPLESPYNLACIEYLNAGDEITDRDYIQRLFATIATTSSRFELIGICAVPSHLEKPDGTHLGYDVCQQRWNSLLSWDWATGPSWDSKAPCDILVRVLLELFSSQLNSDRLFSNLNQATRFVSAVHAIAAVCPGTWESPNHEAYEIVAVSLVA